MINESSKSKKVKMLFSIFLWSIVVNIIFTGFNIVVYNLFFLEIIYDKPFNRWALASSEMFCGYWYWNPGKVLCVVNVIVSIIPFILWYVLKYQR